MTNLEIYRMWVRIGGEFQTDGGLIHPVDFAKAIFPHCENIEDMNARVESGYAESGDWKSSDDEKGKR